MIIVSGVCIQCPYSLEFWSSAIVLGMRVFLIRSSWNKHVSFGICRIARLSTAQTVRGYQCWMHRKVKDSPGQLHSMFSFHCLLAQCCLSDLNAEFFELKPLCLFLEVEAHFLSWG